MKTPDPVSNEIFPPEQLPHVSGSIDATHDAWSAGGQQASHINRGGLVIEGRTGDLGTSLIADLRCRVFEFNQQRFNHAEIEVVGSIWRLKM